MSNTMKNITTSPAASRFNAAVEANNQKRKRSPYDKSKTKEGKRQKKEEVAEEVVKIVEEHQREEVRAVLRGIIERVVAQAGGGEVLAP